MSPVSTFAPGGGAFSTNTIKIGNASSVMDVSGSLIVNTIKGTGNKTPSIANITVNNDVAGYTAGGAGLVVGNNFNAGDAKYRLYLGGGDTNHTIYSTGSNGNKTFFCEYATESNSWNFYNTVNATTVATISNTGGYSQTSDRNRKKDFEPSTLGLHEILQLKPTLFRYKNKTDKTEEVDQGEPKTIGFIAQEVQPIIPQAYSESSTENDTFIGLNHIAFIPVLVKAIQDMKVDYDTKITKLEERILLLEQKL